MEDIVSPSFAWTQKHYSVSLSLTSTPSGPAAPSLARVQDGHLQPSSGLKGQDTAYVGSFLYCPPRERRPPSVPLHGVTGLIFPWRNTPPTRLAHTARPAPSFSTRTGPWFSAFLSQPFYGPSARVFGPWARCEASSLKGRRKGGCVCTAESRWCWLVQLLCEP